MKFGTNLPIQRSKIGAILAHFEGIIRPNIRLNVAEYSVSADTIFGPIGRSLLISYYRVFNI